MLTESLAVKQSLQYLEYPRYDTIPDLMLSLCFRKARESVSLPDTH